MSKQKKMPLQTIRPPSSSRVFPPRRDYASLSMKDLLDAREAYHIHLSRLDNVVATAIGRYFIHEKDWYAQNPPDRPRPEDFPRVTEPRTLANSVVRPWSWPAVIVFVRQWQDRKTLGTEMVPRTLYLADGRIVPTCVVEAVPDETPPPPRTAPFHVSALLGGGYACVREHQGELSSGTIACLVRKGGSYYALTNRHVAGGDGEVVQAYIRGNLHRIGKTSNIAVDRQLLPEVFANWAGEKLYLTLDAGLIRIDDISDWTSQAFGIGEIGEIFDATEYTVTLDLIGCPVRAFGGASGVCEGEIRALFFRFATESGYEFASDVLIGSQRLVRSGIVRHPFTQPGDSGTLWFYDPPPADEAEGSDDLENSGPIVERGTRARRLRPIAMQWGGQRLVLPDGERSAFALGSFLSTICRSLDVEVVRNWSLGHDEYWGKIGHFSIGWKACDQVTGSLGDLMTLNQERIGFGNDILSAGAAFRVDRKKFVPLADVPDYVWIAQQKLRAAEPIQHFADIDIYDIDGGPPLLERCVADPKNIAASVWKTYFDGFGAQGVGPEAGVLPFRVWQIWDAMVGYVEDHDVLHFVAAAGILAHYVGDASQPLHCSFLHHGVPPMKTINGRKYPLPKKSAEAEAFKKTRPAKIHGIYEETMLEVDPLKALTDVDTILAGSHTNVSVSNGHGAAIEIIKLMNRSQTRLKPSAIINADNPAQTEKERAAALWNNAAIRKATIESLADSVRVLANLWTTAWKKGGGNGIPKSKLVELEKEALIPVYRDPKFLESLSLDLMAGSGKFEPE